MKRNIAVIQVGAYWTALALSSVTVRFLTEMFRRRKNTTRTWGSGSMTHRKVDGIMKEKFDESTIDEYFDARHVCVRLAAVYDQTSTAHHDSEAYETPALKSIEKELLGEYLEVAQDAANRLKALEDRIPLNVLEAVLKKLPESVLRDILELQR